MNSTEELARQIFVAMMPQAFKRYMKESPGKEEDWYKSYAGSAFVAAQAFEEARKSIDKQRQEAPIKRAQERDEKAAKLQRMLKETKRRAHER